MGVYVCVQLCIMGVYVCVCVCPRVHVCMCLAVYVLCTIEGRAVYNDACNISLVQQ